tara:strand:+ start:7101 stop:8801 length:1701 start_codon:yes stop_codon:yes gene_type:complete
MKRIIFTIFDDIDSGTDRWGVADAASHMHNEYFDKLVANKENYANSINVEFKLYHNTMNDFDVVGELEFTKVNLYKHHLMAKLAEEYDEVMYVDMDVLFNTDENVFDELDLNSGIHIIDQDKDIEHRDINEVIFEMIGLRNPTLKYHITRDLLGGKENHVMNTGIMIAKSKHIKQIKFIERLPSIIEKISKLKESNTVYLRTHYYPNNESVFSYIIEEYNIPYVIMDREWHYLVDHYPNEIDPNAKIYHFVNKKFNAFFNDKTQAIFSIYIDIPDEDLDSPSDFRDDPVPKSKRTKERFAKYKDRLENNHKEYANAINAEYLIFGRDKQYEDFKSRFPMLSEYDVINLYKIYLLDKLVNEYDLVMYIDMDVYFRRNINVFNYVPCESIWCCMYETPDQAGVRFNNSYYLKWYRHDFRNPESKFWNAHALLTEEDLDTNDLVIFNTGIMMSSKNVMDKIDYFSDIDEVIETMTEVKEYSMYTDPIRDSFGYDNETIMSYKVCKNNVSMYDMPKWWHHKNHYWSYNSFDSTHRDYELAKHEYVSKTIEANSVIIHFISKHFELAFDEK